MCVCVRVSTTMSKHMYKYSELEFFWVFTGTYLLRANCSLPIQTVNSIVQTQLTVLVSDMCTLDTIVVFMLFYFSKMNVVFVGWELIDPANTISMFFPRALA